MSPAREGQADDRRRSVLMVSPQFFPVVGGYERAAERLSFALQASVARLTVVTFSRNRCPPSSGLIAESNIVRLRSSKRRGFTTISTIATLVWFLMRHGLSYSVWHCHAPTPAVGAAVLFGRLVGIPVIVKLPSSPQGGPDEAFSRGLLGRLGLILPVIRGARAILTMTEVGIAEARRMGFCPERLKLIPNGVDVDRFRPTTSSEKVGLRKNLGLPHSALIVLAVSRLEPEKDLATLLTAWSRAVRRGLTPAILVVVGSGSLQRELQSMAEFLGVEGSVLFVGEKRNVEDWYGIADIYVLPSRREGLSNSLLEAMASGLPVVMTQVSGSQVVSQDPAAGFVVPIGDAHDLADKLSRLIEDTVARESMASNARRRIAAEYSLDSIQRQMLSLYDELINQSIMGSKLHV